MFKQITRILVRICTRNSLSGPKRAFLVQSLTRIGAIPMARRDGADSVLPRYGSKARRREWSKGASFETSLPLDARLLPHSMESPAPARSPDRISSWEPMGPMESQERTDRTKLL